MDRRRSGKEVLGVSTTSSSSACRRRNNDWLHRELRAKSNVPRTQQRLEKLARLSKTLVVEIWLASQKVHRNSSFRATPAKAGGDMEFRNFENSGYRLSPV